MRPRRTAVSGVSSYKSATVLGMGWRASTQERLEHGLQPFLRVCQGRYWGCRNPALENDRWNVLPVL